MYKFIPPSNKNLFYYQNLIYHCQAHNIWKYMLKLLMYPPDKVIEIIFFVGIK